MLPREKEKNAAGRLSPVTSRRKRHHFPIDLGRQLLLRLLEVIRDLQIEPRLRISPKVTRKAQRRIERDTTALKHDVVHARSRNPQRDRKRMRRHLQRYQKIFPQYLAGMDGAHFVLGFHGWAFSVYQW